MFRLNSTKWIVLLVIVAIIAVGIMVGRDENHFTTQTAVGQTIDDDFEYLERANRAFIGLVNRVTPSVVQVTTKKLIKERRFQHPFDEDLFDYFFPRRDRGERDRGDDGVERESRGLGSGVIVSDDGYILTNNHVIEGADDITVVLQNGQDYKAELVGRDAGSGGTDLAVLKIDGKGLPALAIGNSDELQVGEWVIAVGSPFGLSQTVTRGIVSAKGRSNNGIATYADFIQTDAPINRGNSGGALINIRGELIGINTAIYTNGSFAQGNVGIGFAIPSNLVKRIMTDLIDKGEVERGWLGVHIGQNLTPELAEAFKLDEPRGALITGVIKGTPAAEGGVKRGDVIVEIDNIPIRDSSHLLHVVAAFEVGKTVKIKAIRRGKEKNLKVKLGRRPPQEELVAMRRNGRSPRFIPAPEDDVEAFASIQVRDLTDELAQRYGHEDEKGVVVVDVERQSPAAKAGVEVGDLIQEIEWEKIEGLSDYIKRIKEVKNESKVTLYVKHAGGRGEYLTLKNLPQDK